MKKLLFLFMVAGLFQSCCGPIYLWCPYDDDTNTNNPHSDAQKAPNAQNVLEEPSAEEVKVVESPVMLSNLSPIIGIGKSWVGGPESGESWEDPLGGQIGVETKLMVLNDNSSFNIGINLSLQGAAYTEQYDSFDPYYGNALKSATADVDGFSGKVTLSYLNIPFLYSYQSNGGFYGEVGLQPGLLISAKDKMDGGESFDYKDQVKAFELGLPVGIGYQINDQLSFGARATWGITNMSDSGSGDKDHNYLVIALVRYSIGSIDKK